MNLENPIYTDENAAREHLESLRWPNGPICPHCGVVGNAVALNGKSTRPGVYKCRDCRKPFSVTVGTVFERSKIPLNKWLLANHMLTSGKKGTSSHQIHRTLGVTYKTAWFMTHRIREATLARLVALASRLRRMRPSWASLRRLARRLRCTQSRIA